jgi:hypothetical protein
LLCLCVRLTRDQRFDRRATGKATSSSFVSRNPFDLRRNFVFSRLQVVMCLNIQPESRRGIEKLAEPQRGIGGCGPFFAREAFNPGPQYIECRGDGIWR